MITKNPKNILIADDSVFYRTRLSDILVEAGHSVRFAWDGRAVMNELRIDPGGIDLLVLDLQMPNVDGFEVLEWMKENEYLGKFPVLALTEITEPGQRPDRAKELGAAGLITKDFTPEQIVHRVNRLLFPEKISDRVERRVPISIPANLWMGDDTYTGSILNLSTTGAYLHTREELFAESMVHLKFTLPVMHRTFDLDGVVKWSIRPGGGKNYFGGSGIMFTSISTKTQDELKNFVIYETRRLGLDG